VALSAAEESAHFRYRRNTRTSLGNAETIRRPHGRDKHAVRLSIGAYEEIVAASIDETDFLIESDGTWISFPHAEPKVSSFECPRRVMNGAYQQLRNALSMGRAIDVKAMQLDGRIDKDSGRRILALDLSESDEICFVVCQQRDHAWATQFLGLLGDPEGFFQVRIQVLGTILASKSFFKSACGEYRECRSVGFDTGANEKGLRIHHGRRPIVDLRWDMIRARKIR
jgi:hypothetical protein